MPTTAATSEQCEIRRSTSVSSVSKQGEYSHIADFAQAPKGQPDTIVATSDLKFHGRVRGLLSISFTDEALQGQRPILQHHANNLVARLRQLIASSESSPSGALVNMPDWTNFFTADVISDLAFGKSFGCLELGEYHTWVQTLYNWAKVGNIQSVSFLPGNCLRDISKYFPL